MNYLTRAPVGTRQTPQSQPIPGSDQVENSAGGYAYGVDKWTRLNRFLILGSEGGSYYASEQKLTKENAQCVMQCIKEDGPRTVAIITAISQSGRAPKNDPAIFALAMASALGDELTRRVAYNALSTVCRIGTHLFHFAQYREMFAGWSAGLRRAVGRWYTEKDLDALAYQVIKYRQRDGWTHRDLLRLAHPKAKSDEQNLLLRYITEIPTITQEDRDNTVPNEVLPQIVHGYEAAQRTDTDAEKAAELVREYGLPREALKTEHLRDPHVWEAMLYEGGKYGMPITALIRNLATMTRVGLLAPNSDATRKVIEMVTAENLLKHARVHPIAVLAALKTYEAGYSPRGKAEWSPVPQIVDALDDAFYMTFDNVEPTGKR